MTATFYNFSKRSNSTKIPTGSGTDITILLKEDTSIHNPSIILEGSNFNYNYVYISNFGRYYFVEDIVILANNLTQYNLVEDVLASNKAAIGNTVARIAFSSTGWDKDLIDNRIDVKTTKLKYTANASSGLSSEGCYIFTVVNDQNLPGNGMGVAYCVDGSVMAEIRKAIGTQSIVSSIEQYFNGKFTDLTLSCIWEPFPLSANPGAAYTTAYVGDTNLLIAGDVYVLPANSLTSLTEVSITIPFRYNDFRDSEPYTTAQLYLPGVGLVDISMNDLLDSTKIKIIPLLEYATGNVMYLIQDGNGKLLKTVSFNASCVCPLAGTVTNAGGTISGIAGMAGGAVAATAGLLTGNVTMALGGAGGVLASAGHTALAANTRQTSIKGQGGSRADVWDTEIRFFGYYMDTEDCTNASYIATKGRPVAQSHAISTHSGYIECDGASIDIGGENVEREEINSYLNGGFYYE